jgi:hypothetical protein
MSRISGAGEKNIRSRSRGAEYKSRISGAEPEYQRQKDRISELEVQSTRSRRAEYQDQASRVPGAGEQSTRSRRSEY